VQTLLAGYTSGEDKHDIQEVDDEDEEEEDEE
jgi:hypothetical protein